MNLNSEVEQKKFIANVIDEYIRPQSSRLELAQKRQQQFFAHEKNDKVSVRITGEYPSFLDEVFPVIPDEDIELEFFDILCRWLQISIHWLSSSTDMVPFIYSQFGTGTNLACIGMEQIREHGTYGKYGPPHPIDLESAKKLTVDDIKVQGTFAKALDFMDYALEMTGGVLPVFRPDCQSPFDLACMMLGNEFFIMVLQDPETTHEILDFCVELYCRSVELAKERVGEKMTEMHGGAGGKSSRTFGTQLSIDHAVMFSPEAVEEFVIPSCCRTAEKFGSVAVHYCGWHEQLTRQLADKKEISVLNNGVIAAKNEIEFDLIMQLCRDSGSVYAGYMPIGEEESAKDYIDKIHGLASEGIFLPKFGFNAVKQKTDCPWKSANELADYWYSK